MRISLRELREKIRSTLNENLHGVFQATVHKLPKDASVFFHLSDLNKVGINPTSTFKTPIAICTYPLNEETAEMLLDNTLPFASERRFVHFLKPRNPSKIVYFQHLKMNDAIHLWQRITEANGLNVMIDKQHWTGDAGTAFWSACHEVWQDKPVQWTHALVKAGIEGVVDLGGAIFHENEPAQGAFFSAKFIDVVAAVENVPKPGKQQQAISFCKQEFEKLLKKLIEQATGEKNVNETKTVLNNFFATMRSKANKLKLPDLEINMLIMFGMGIKHDASDFAIAEILDNIDNIVKKQPTQSNFSVLAHSIARQSISPDLLWDKS